MTGPSQPEELRRPLRLYRGLKRKYRPERVDGLGTDFTDNPWVALHYARARYGVIVVIDVPYDPGPVGAHTHHPHLAEEDWLALDGARRFLFWGPFDGFIRAIIPAKECRAVVNRKGVRGASDQHKRQVLAQAIDRHLELGEPRPPLEPPSWLAFVS